MDKMGEICRTLDAVVLTVLVPKGSRIGIDDLASGLEYMVSTFSQHKTRVAVELREETSKKVIDNLKHNDAIHCVHISRE